MYHGDKPFSLNAGIFNLSILKTAPRAVFVFSCRKWVILGKEEVLLVKKEHLSEPVYFTDATKIFPKEMLQNFRQSMKISVYLPLDNTTSDQREQIRREWAESIKQAIKEVFQDEKG